MYIAKKKKGSNDFYEGNEKQCLVKQHIIVSAMNQYLFVSALTDFAWDRKLWRREDSWPAEPLGSSWPPRTEVLSTICC